MILSLFILLVYASVPCIPRALAALALCTLANMLSSSHTSGALRTACNAALKDRNYDSKRTRKMMSQKLQDIFDGRIPYDWQLDAAEALVLGLDCVMIAGTGAGKTIPFMLPLFV